MQVIHLNGLDRALRGRTFPQRCLVFEALGLFQCFNFWSLDLIIGENRPSGDSARAFESGVLFLAQRIGRLALEGRQGKRAGRTEAVGCERPLPDLRYRRNP